MSEALTLPNALPPATPDALEKIGKIADKLGELPQLHIQTEHILHAGMYARTIRLAPGTALVGAHIKVPTMLIVRGDASVLAGDKWYRIKDYQVIPTMAGRKQVFVAHGPTELTMICRCLAKTVAEAEEHFTDEADKLMSRRDGDDDLVLITGVEPCPEQ